ncbi:MAG: flagellar hook-length control protein FliK [Planctomycetaceae bacterium]|jgi:flagellar hook-length control protein FliK|nr:flagellar hook-length control protein FliK [Planctomycetaceae bacterium]
MIAEPLSAASDPQTPGTAPSQEEVNETAQDEFLKQLQAIQTKSTRQKQVQDKLISERQNKIVDQQNKTPDKEDLERDEQRKANSRGGYTLADLRRGADLIDIAGKTPVRETSPAVTGESMEPFSAENVRKNEFNTQTPPMEKTGLSRHDFPWNAAFPEQTASVPNNIPSQQPVMSAAQVREFQRQNGERDAASNAALRALQTGQTASAISLAGLTPVTGKPDASLESHLETKIASALKQIGELRGKHDNTLTKEAVTAVAGISPQTARDGIRQSGKDSAVSQLPQTSLYERIDQAMLTQRITNVFRSFAGQPDGTVRMKLHPEELGAVTLRMKTEDGRVTAKIETETQTAKNVLLGNLEQLREKLAKQNIRLDAFEVEVLPEFSEHLASGSLSRRSPAGEDFRETSERPELSRRFSPAADRIDVVG